MTNKHNESDLIVLLRGKTSIFVFVVSTLFFVIILFFYNALDFMAALWYNVIVIFMQWYRSGHNGHDSKS